MSSPFTGYENTTLTFKVPGAASTDPVTGNKVFARSDVVVLAMLNQKPRTERQLERSPGVDQQAVYLEGYAIDPSTLPATVKPNTWADCIWSGTPGQFYLMLTGKSPFGVELATGEKIRGWFQAKA